MERAARLAGLLLIAVGLAGCSSSDPLTPESVVESAVSSAVREVTDIFEQLDPFAPAPPLLGKGCAVVADNDELCPDGGLIEDCGDGQFDFDGCASSAPIGPYTITGSVNFELADDWPAGGVTLTVDEPTDYTMLFNGTDEAAVTVTGALGPAQCAVELDFSVATCTVL
jgi:hypothetical protein